VPAPRKYPGELRERAVRLVFEKRREQGRMRGPIAEVGEQLGINPETLRNWIKQAEIEPASGPVARPTTPPGSLSWNGRSVSCDGPTRSSSPRRPSSRRSSTAHIADGHLHRRTPGGVRGRADLRAAADRSCHLPAPQEPNAVPARAGRRAARDRGGPRVRGELRGLWAPQGLGPAQSGGHPDRPGPHRAAHEAAWHLRCRAGPQGPHHHP
jgi:transposase-like protein